HQASVGLVAVVDAVIHWTVEVDVIAGELSTELDHIEVAVAPDQRIKGPDHPVKALGQRPGPLVLLEPVADAEPLRARQHAGDVTVQDISGYVASRESDRGTRTGSRAAGDGDAVAGVGERPAQLRWERLAAVSARPTAG